MKSQRLLFATCLGAALTPAAIHAQSDVPIQFLMRDTGWTISVGARSSSSVGKVKFGNLGTVPPDRSVDIAGISRVYNNGQVFIDNARTNELDANGNVITTPGTRYPIYLTNADGVRYLAGDYLAYTPGQTRSWAYSSADQVTNDGRIGMSIFSAQSEGASADVDASSGGGVEVALGRRLGTLANNKVEWGISGSIALTDVNRKTSGTILSTLTTQTDYYRTVGGTIPEAPYTGASYVNLNDSEGNLVTVNGVETTTPLYVDSLGRTTTTRAGGATVDGNWQIKGAYYLMRLGPSVRAKLSERFAVSGSAGVAGAYVGTKYKVKESLRITGGAGTVEFEDEAEETDFIVGFYGEVNLEFWFTPRTGIYAGASYEALGDYEQMMGSRTAEIDLGSSAGFRFGLTTRF